MSGALLFDLDNTLILEDACVRAAVRAAAELAVDRHGVDLQRLSAAAARRADHLWRTSSLFAQGEALGVWWGELLWGVFTGGGWISDVRAFLPAYRRAVWRGALATVGVNDEALAREMEEAYVAARRLGEIIDPDAAAVLADVARDHRLALVTNGAGDVQREKLARTPFASVFDAVLVSSEIGVGKPDPAIFRRAMDALGVDARHAAMVGDSLVRDIAGAAAAGIASVWIDRRLWDEDGVVPDARIERLGQLRAALNGLPAARDARERQHASPRAKP